MFVIASDRIEPDYFGADPISANIGAANVYGWEIEAELMKTTLSGFTFWISHSWAYAYDKIIAKGDPELKPKYQKFAGYQIGQPRQTLNQGPNSVINTWNEIYSCAPGSVNKNMLLPGDFMRIDFNCDGVIDANDNVPYGFPSRPQYSYSPAIGASYKNISAQIRFYGVYNVEGVHGETETTSFMEAAHLNTAYIKEKWLPENGITTNAIRSAFRYWTSPTSGYVDRPRSYIRLENAEIAYSLRSNTSSMVKRMGLSNLKFTLSGHNIALWSKMLSDKDYDGEAQTDERFNYPVLRRFNLGVSIDF